MDRRDGRLNRIRSEATRRERTLHERETFVDVGTIPPRAILIVEQYDLSVGSGARRAP